MFIFLNLVPDVTTSYAIVAPLLFLLAQVLGLVLEENFQFSILDTAYLLPHGQLQTH